MVWLRALAEQAGGESRAKLLLQGKGISMILKKIDIDFKVGFSTFLRFDDGSKLFLHSAR